VTRLWAQRILRLLWAKGRCWLRWLVPAEVGSISRGEAFLTLAADEMLQCAGTLLRPRRRKPSLLPCAVPRTRTGVHAHGN
jgi:hypothetical protein